MDPRLGSRDDGKAMAMSARRSARTELKDTGYELFIGAVSVLSIVNLVLMYVVRESDLDTVLLVMNGLLSTILFLDFVYRLWTAPSRSAYFFRQFGWADLLASLPVQQLKLLRLFRLFRVGRLLRENGGRHVLRSLARHRAGSALLTLVLLGILVLEFGSLSMLRLEQGDADANITSASDAIWYVMVTISTVGYGDQFPVTTAGRVLGSGIIVLGVAIFGTFTGYLANLFVARRRPVVAEPADDPRQRVEHLRTLLAQQQATIDELDELLQRRP